MESSLANQIGVEREPGEPGEARISYGLEAGDAK
jgi:hypothetical protein